MANVHSIVLPTSTSNLNDFKSFGEPIDDQRIMFFIKTKSRNQHIEPTVTTAERLWGFVGVPLAPRPPPGSRTRMELIKFIVPKDQMKRIIDDIPIIPSLLLNSNAIVVHLYPMGKTKIKSKIFEPVYWIEDLYVGNLKNWHLHENTKISLYEYVEDVQM